MGNIDPPEQQESTEEGINALLKQLMESSDYSFEDFKAQPLEMIREVMFRLASLITPVAAISTAIYAWRENQPALAMLDAIASVPLIAHAHFLLKKNFRLFSPFVLMLITLVLLACAVLLGNPQFIYWAFAYPAAFYILVERPLSLQMSVIWWIVCSTLATMLLAPMNAMNFILCLGATSFMTEVLCSILYRHEDSLKQLAVRDPLTHAYNRRAMLETMEQALTIRDRYNTPSSIVMADIDRFKAINDSYGHKEGDAVLIKLVDKLSQRLRRTDKLCRYGGEEFVAILMGVNLEQAANLAQSFCDEIRVTELTAKTPTTISCGVAEARRNETAGDWLHRCDMALYRAKMGGRDRVELEEPA